jgi:hypothetical protein
MTRQTARDRRRTGATRLALALVIALLGASPVRAEEPLAGPLFDANRRDSIYRENLIRAIVGNAAIPTTGPWASLAVLYAGAHESVSLWSLEGPLTNVYSRRALGASTLVLGAPQGLLGGPLTVAAVHAAMLHAGADADCWRWYDPNKLVGFHRDELRVISDGKPVPVGTDETAVYARALIRAHRASLQAFARATRRDVTHNHVSRDPDLYRGAVMHVEGRLKRINRYQPMREVALAGVNDAYEAWVFPEHLGSSPFCVLFTEWPKGLPRELLGQATIDAPIRVSVDGFFFKNFRYAANDGRNGQRDAPLLIGHSLVVLTADTADGGRGGASRWLVFGFAGVLAVLILGSVGVTYWYRRTDSRIRRRILAAQSQEWVPPPPDAVPVAAPVGGAPVRMSTNGADRRPFPPRITTFPTGRGDRGAGGEDGGQDKPPEESAGA